MRVLGERGNLDGLAALDAPRRGLKVPAQQVQDRRLTGAVHADDADALGGGQAPGDALEDVQARAVGTREGHGDVLEVDDVLAQARGRHLHQLHGVTRGRHIGDEGLGGGDVELGLRGAGRGPAAQPRELLGEQVSALGGGHVRLAHALGAGQRVGGVGAVVDFDVPGDLRAVTTRVDAGNDLPDVLAHGVEEPAVVGDSQERAGRAGAGEAGVQVRGQPGHALDVEVVGGLVQAHNVGGGREDSGERNAAALTARQRADEGGGVDVGEEAGVDVAHGRVGRPLVFLHAGVNGLDDGVLGVKGVRLGEDGDAHAVATGHHSPVGLLRAGDDAQERGLSGAVGAENADAAAVVEADRDSFEELTRSGEGADVLGSEQVCHQMASVDSMRAP